MPGAARVGDNAQNQSDAHGCPGCPHNVIGPAIQGSTDVKINDMWAFREGDPGVHSACCGGGSWNAKKGSPDVFVNGKPLMRKDDQTQHCGGMGKMIAGSGDVIING